jgi:hypothetical protein
MDLFQFFPDAAAFASAVKGTPCANEPKSYPGAGQAFGDFNQHRNVWHFLHLTDLVFAQLLLAYLVDVPECPGYREEPHPESLHLQAVVQKFRYGPGRSAPLLKCVVPVWACAACDAQVANPRARESTRRGDRGVPSLARGTSGVNPVKSVFSFLCSYFVLLFHPGVLTGLLPSEEHANEISDLPPAGSPVVCQRPLLGRTEAQSHRFSHGLEPQAVQRHGTAHYQIRRKFSMSLSFNGILARARGAGAGVRQWASQHSPLRTSVAQVVEEDVAEDEADEIVLNHAELVLGRYFGLALGANHPGGIAYAEQALDGMRGIRTLKRLGYLEKEQQRHPHEA